LATIASRGASLPHPLVYSTDDDVADPNGEDPYTNYWDLSDDPLRFYAQNVQLIKNLLPTVLDRSVRVGDDWTALYRTVYTFVGNMENAAAYASKFIGGRVISKAHRGDPNAPEYPVTSIAFDTQQRALDIVLSILTDDTLLNSTTSPAINYMLARRAPCIGSLSSYCDGLASGALAERFYLLQQHLIDWLLSPARLRRLYENWRYDPATRSQSSPQHQRRHIADHQHHIEQEQPHQQQQQQQQQHQHHEQADQSYESYESIADAVQAEQPSYTSEELPISVLVPDDDDDIITMVEVPDPSLVDDDNDDNDDEPQQVSIMWLLDAISAAIVTPDGPQYDTIKVYYIDKLVSLSASMISPIQVEIASHLFFLQATTLARPTTTNYFLQIKLGLITRRPPAFGSNAKLQKESHTM
jgi:hypothetical protein